MPGSTLVGVFVTTTHRISAVESEFRAGPALARDFGASLEVQTEPWRSSRDVGSGAVKPSFGLLITRAAARTRAIHTAPFSQTGNNLVLNLRSSERTR